MNCYFIKKNAIICIFYGILVQRKFTTIMTNTNTFTFKVFKKYSRYKSSKVVIFSNFNYKNNTNFD